MSVRYTSSAPTRKESCTITGREASVGYCWKGELNDVRAFCFHPFISHCYLRHRPIYEFLRGQQ
jgi:hypothetical protein